ncbi:type II toxin-antitoxin system VapC family toxin [bacterium]|nr:type II toxin-antitoxin system VapC family toxin [bacterium]
MKVVVDTSVIMSILVNEEHKSNIIMATKNADIVAPASLHWEIGNAFSAMFKRNRISMNQATKALSFYYKIPIRFVDIDLESAIKLSNQCRICAYDAYFIICAQIEKAALITLDKGLEQVTRELGLKVIGV